MSKPIEGIITAVVTPFKDNESIDEAAFKEIIDYLVDSGVHGLFPVGSQGEFFALSMDERKRLIDLAVEYAAGRVFVMPNTGCISTKESVDLSRHAENAGADCLSVITPFYISPNQSELYDHYRDICAAVSIPVLAYNNPDRTGGVKITVDTIGRLARDLPNFAGIKDSSGDLTETGEIIRRTPPGFKVFLGRDSIIFPALMMGATGAVAASSNVAPKLVVGIYDAVKAGEYKVARELQQKLAPVRIAFGLGTFPMVVKEALNMMGLPGGRMRRPVGGLTDEAREKLRQILTDAELL